MSVFFKLIFVNFKIKSKNESYPQKKKTVKKLQCIRIHD